MSHVSTCNCDATVTRNQCTAYVPTRFGVSGKNSARTGNTQPCFLMMGLTSDATRWSIGRVMSDLGMFVRWVKDLTKMSDIAIEV